jgi:hypothetical protein
VPTIGDFKLLDHFYNQFLFQRLALNHFEVAFVEFTVVEVVPFDTEIEISPF